MRPIYIFLLFGLVTCILFSSGQIENPDTHLRLTQTRIIVDEHKFGLAEDVGENTHGNIAVNQTGQRYMVYNPGQSITFIPLYYFANLITEDEVNAYYLSAYLVSFLNYIVHALCTFLLFKIALLIGASRKQSFLTSIFFGITSYSFVFAQSTYEHHFEMLFILSSAYFALNKKANHSGLLSGFMLSCGLIFRTTTILSLPAILVLQRNNKERFKTLISLTQGVAFVLFYNYYRFGDPLESGYSLAWSLAHSDRFSFWSISMMPKAVFGFLCSPGKGILFFSTTFILSLWGLRTFVREQQKVLYSILLICMAYVGAFSLNFAWHGSVWSFGPRYILPVIPFLYLPIIHLKPLKWVYIVLFLAFIFQVELISVNYKRDVLSDYVVQHGLSDMEYLFSINKEPHFVQANQLFIISPKNFGKLHNYQPNTPWKKEIRSASNVEVLNSSIEKNALNFWWVRIFHWNTSFQIRFFSILVLSIALIGAYILFQYVRKELV